MCGFAVIVHRTESKPVSTSRIESSLKKRGVSLTQFSNKNFHGWQSRLPIISEKTGRLPVLHGPWVMFGAGQILNFRDLFSHLQKEDLPIARAGDLSTALMCFVRHGEEAFSWFRGPFSIAVWNSETERLWLARDRLGRRPLFCNITHDQISFATSISSMWAMSLCLDYDPTLIAQFFATGTTETDGTVEDGIESVPAGDLWICSFNQLKKHTLHSVSLDKSSTFPELLNNAMRRVMESDSIPSVALSAGVDSSFVAYSATQFGKIDTWTIVAPKDKDGTGERARYVARLFGCRHHEICFEPLEPESVFDIIRYTTDRPASTPAIIHNELLHKNLDTKVLIGGHGADEVLGGYLRYQKIALGHLPYWPRAYHALQWSKEVYSGFFWDARVTAPLKDGVTISRWVDLMLLQSWDNLHLPDENGLSNRVEVRSPYLDEDLVEHAFTYVRTSKDDLRSLLEGVLPNYILFGPKVGFDVPFKYEEWIQKNRNIMMEYITQSKVYEYIPEYIKVGILSLETCKKWPLLLWRAFALAAYCCNHRNPQMRHQ